MMILCDGHVHLHACYAVDDFLSAALINFSTFAGRRGNSTESVQFVLWLTESAGMDKFAELSKAHGDSDCHPDTTWRIRPTREPISLIAQHGEDEIILVAGRQVVCAERIEILALGTQNCIDDGNPLVKTIYQILDCGALPVLPWGFGKWIGRRGKIVEDCIRTEDRLHLGDNGGRLACLPPPRLFRLARQQGIYILPGSDALPFPGEHRRVASYGWVQSGVISNHLPGEKLMAGLRDRHNRIAVFGGLENPISFFRNQLKMQLYKRMR